MHIAMIDIDDAISIQKEGRPWFACRRHTIRSILVFDASEVVPHLPTSKLDLRLIWSVSL
jgi:hypothetical protein